MIYMVNFSNAETEYKPQLHKVLHIIASSQEVKEIYQIVMKKPLNIQEDLGFNPTPLIYSLARYEAFLEELTNRKIEFSEVEPQVILF